MQSLMVKVQGQIHPHAKMHLQAIGKSGSSFLTLLARPADVTISEHPKIKVWLCETRSG